MFLLWRKNVVRRGEFSKQNSGLGRGRSRDSQTPQNPDFGPAKKSSLPPAKMCKKWRFWAKKRAFSVNLCTILHKNDLFFADIAPRYRAASPSGKNPPIYTVLNAAFSAPGPPRLWHRGGTPVPDALPRAPDARFDKIEKIDFSKHDDGDRISPMTSIINLIKENFI
jgi:hypothetical protein